MKPSEKYLTQYSESGVQGLVTDNPVGHAFLSPSDWESYISKVISAQRSEASEEESSRPDDFETPDEDTFRETFNHLRLVKVVGLPHEIEINTNGRPFVARVRKLRKREKKMLLRALRYIAGRLPQDEGSIFNKDYIRFAASRVVFIATDSQEICAFTSHDPKLPFIFLNERLFCDLDQSEFAVTVLHELVHFSMAHVWKEPVRNDAAESIEEAMHDFRCYRALALPIPGDHWAFSKYPDFCKRVCTPVGQVGRFN